MPHILSNDKKKLISRINADKSKFDRLKKNLVKSKMALKK